MSNSTSHLLSDKELDGRIRSLVFDVVRNDRSVRRDAFEKSGITLDESVNEFFDLFKSQRKLYADEVIGKDNEFIAADHLHPDAYKMQPILKRFQRERNNV